MHAPPRAGRAGSPTASRRRLTLHSLVFAVVGAVLAAGLTAVADPAPAAADPPTHETGYIPVAVGTGDETTLHYKVILPDPERWGPGPYPAVVDYSGYMPAIQIYDGLDDRFRDAGYAVVGLNMRGTSCSGGTFDYFEPRQSVDGAEAIEWLARRPWSNGRLGMVGKSYPGITQTFVAAEQPEALKAIVPGHIFADLYRDVPFPGGIMNATFAGGWSAQRLYESYLVGPDYAAEHGDEQCLRNQADHVPNAAFNPLGRLLTEQYDGPVFRERSPWEFADRIEVPTFLIESWQDEQVGSRGTHLLERMRDDVPWRFLATNGDHGEYYGEQVFGHILRFLSYYLKREIPEGDGFTVTEPVTMPNGDPHPTKTRTRPATFAEALERYEAEDPVTVNWENGAEGGRRAAWTQTYADWPAPEQEPWRLWVEPDGRLGSDVPRRGSVDYRYVPVAGAQERGGEDLVGEPPADWSERPPDGTFASFTTAPLDRDRVLLGSGSVDLWLSSTAPDTDVEVTLSEVRPDGQEMFVQQGWLRASHRAEDPRWSTELRPFQTHRASDSEPLLHNEPERLRVELFPFGHTFRAGSRIRVTVAAPHTRPDLWGFASVPLPAVNTVHTGGAYRSSVALPLLAGETAGAPLPNCGSLRNQPCRPEPAGGAAG